MLSLIKPILIYAVLFMSWFEIISNILMRFKLDSVSLKTGQVCTVPTPEWYSNLT